VQEYAVYNASKPLILLLLRDWGKNDFFSFRGKLCSSKMSTHAKFSPTATTIARTMRSGKMQLSFCGGRSPTSSGGWSTYRTGNATSATYTSRVLGCLLNQPVHLGHYVGIAELNEQENSQRWKVRSQPDCSCSVHLSLNDKALDLFLSDRNDGGHQVGITRTPTRCARRKREGVHTDRGCGCAGADREHVDP